MSKVGLVVTASLLLFTNALQAQITPDTLKPDAPLIRIDTLFVSAAVPFITRGGASALQVRPDSLRLGPALTIERVVRELPFVQVRSNARGEAYFALRGSSFDAREVAVLVDGLPLSLGFDHRADLAVLPATGASSLTIVRGIPALLYGPNVLGGVVAMTLSDANPSIRPFNMNLGYDETGGYALSAQSTVSMQTPGSRVTFRGGAGYRESSGFPLPSDVQEPAPYGERDIRLNSDRLQRDGFVSARYSTNGGAWVSVSSLGYSSGRGTPAELNTTGARFWRYPETRRVISSAAFGTGERVAPWGGALRIESSVGYDVGRIALNGYTDRSYTTVRDREIDDDRNITARLLAVQTVGRSAELSAAATYADVRREEEISGAALTYQQQMHSAALEAGWRFDVRDQTRVRIHGGFSYDGARTPESADKPEVAAMDTWGARLGFTASPGSSVLFHGGVGRRARFPSLRELYAGPLRMFEPNPDLKPEVLIASELGTTVQLGTTQLQAVVFHHRIDDAIVRSTTATRRVQRVNRDRTTSTGVELMAVVPFRRATMSFDLTMQDVQASDPAADREFRAEYQPKFTGGMRFSTPLLLDTRLDLNARGVGSQYCLDTAGNYTRLASSMRSDVQLSRGWKLPGATRLSMLDAGVAVDNVTDATIFDQCGLPQAGRLLRLRITLR